MDNCIIIPCYNEGKTIKGTIEQVRALGLNLDMIVVDDGSEDGTYDIVKSSFNDHVVVLRHALNLGKGAALKTGCEAAIKKGYDSIFFMDGDGQHPPQAILKMMKMMKDNNLDIVFCSREMNPKEMPLTFYFGNKFLTGITNLLYGVSISDSQSGLKCFRSSIYPKIKWESSDYAVETEIIINTGKNKLRYGETFMKTIYNDKYKGTTPFNGISILLRIIKNRFL